MVAVVQKDLLPLVGVGDLANVDTSQVRYDTLISLQPACLNG